MPPGRRLCPGGGIVEDGGRQALGQESPQVNGIIAIDYGLTASVILQGSRASLTRRPDEFTSTFSGSARRTLAEAVLILRGRDGRGMIADRSIPAHRLLVPGTIGQTCKAKPRN